VSRCRLDREKCWHGDGTLFLDEVAALATPTQAKLLRLLEDGRFRRIGGTEELVSNARIMSSTNAGVSALVDGGQFRRDLYCRLNAIEVRISKRRYASPNYVLGRHCQLN